MRKIALILIAVVIVVFSFLIYRQVNLEKNVQSLELLAENTAVIETATANPTGTPEPSPSPSPTASPEPTLAPDDGEVIDTRLSEADAIISADIEAGFPGAVLLVTQNGQTLYCKAYGSLQIYDGMTELETPVAMRTDTVFDLASLTKIYSTTLAIMKLVDGGYISLDQHVYEILPAFNKEQYNEITIRQLLTHTSGYPSDVKFFRSDVEEGAEFYSTDRDNTISLLSEVPLENEPGQAVQYSDIGYMVLGAVVESVSGMRLDNFVYANIYSPLGLTQISYLPLENGMIKDNIACTERMGNSRDGLVTFEGIRRYTLQGEVHDEKAYYSMGGVSGHAGLFANAESIAALNQLLLNGGTLDGVTVFSADTVNLFTSIYGESIYQLGFVNSQNIKSLSETVPYGTLSHSGWTGVFSLIDKENNLSIVLLTNKRHSVFDGEEFEAAYFDTGQYYSVVNAVYEGLGLS